MGAINYKTSDYITIGIKPYDYKDYEDENGNIDYDEMNYDYECDFVNVKATLEKYDFSFFHVTMELGYYEGFMIDIESNNDLCYDCWQDKKAALKEVTRLKLFLLECVDLGLCQVFPGWCPGYATRDESIKAIKKAMKELKETIKHTPTWNYCERMGIEA